MEAIREATPHRNDEKQFMGIAQRNLEELDSLLLNAPLPVAGKKKSD